jgi:hypothetical protein
MFACMCMWFVCVITNQNQNPVREGEPEEPNDPEFDAEDTYASKGKSHRPLLDHIAPIVRNYPLQP